MVSAQKISSLRRRDSSSTILTNSEKVTWLPFLDYSHIAFLKVLKDINCLPDYYLSPEQLEAVRHVDYNSQEDYKVQTAGDIFSLGMVMLECLTLESSSKYYSVKGLELKS